MCVLLPAHVVPLFLPLQQEVAQEFLDEGREERRELAEVEKYHGLCLPCKMADIVLPITLTLTIVRYAHLFDAKVVEKFRTLVWQLCNPTEWVEAPVPLL